MLLVFGGLPGSGKSTISADIARKLEAVYLRVDTIEQRLRDTGINNVGATGISLRTR